MTIPRLVNRYVLLVRALFFPSRWLRWIALVGLCLALPASLAHALSGWLPLAVVAGLGDMLMAVSLLVGAIALPSQLVAINSSRQFAFLAVRRASLLLVFLFCLGLPSGTVGVLLFFDKPTSWSLFLGVFTLASALLLVGIVLAIQIPMGQNFIFFFAWVWAPLAKAIIQISPLWLVLGGGVIWLLFSVWWLRWRPEKYQASVFGLQQKDMLKWQLEQHKTVGIKKYLAWINMGVLWGSGKPDSVMGSVLSGVSDGHYALWKKAICGLVIFMTVMIFVRFSNGVNAPDFISFLFFYMIYLMSGWAILFAICRNLPRAWLLCKGARPQFFKDVEWHYARLLCYSLSPLVFFHLVYSLVVASVSLGWLFAIFLAAYSVLLLTAAFYLVLMVYARAGLALGWLGFVGFLVMTFGGALLLIITDRWSAALPFALKLSVSSLVVLAIGCLQLRNMMQRRWDRISFQRAYT